MAREVRDYAGGAVDTTLTSGINSTDLSIQIDDATGWPTGGANGPFFIVVSYDVAGKEKIEVASRTGTTLTVANTGKRGVDGTSAASHSSGAKVRHCLTAQDHDEFNSHAFDTTQDDHTQYLNNARHDITGRHTPGSVIPVAAPGAIQPDDTADAGVAGSLARSDHRHAITAAVAGTITPDAVAAEGVATSFARSDHEHAITAGTPSQVGTFLSEGVAAAFARSDHLHELGPGSVDTADRIAAGIITIDRLFDSQGFTDFDPTWDNVSLGTGTQQNYGRYVKILGLVLGTAGFQLGTSGNVTGNIALNLPSTATNPDDTLWTNAQWFAAGRGVNGATLWASVGNISDATGLGKAANFATGGSGPWDATFPFNWTTGDRFFCFFAYQEA